MNISAEKLKSYVERVERLEEEKSALNDDVKSVFAEAKSDGFDVKTLKAIIKLRKLADNEVEEQEILLETYKRALGMVMGGDGDEEI